MWVNWHVRGNCVENNDSEMPVTTVDVVDNTADVLMPILALALCLLLLFREDCDGS